MQEPVEDCGGDDIVDKDLSPLLERLLDVMMMAPFS